MVMAAILKVILYLAYMRVALQYDCRHHGVAMVLLNSIDQKISVHFF